MKPYEKQISVHVQQHIFDKLLAFEQTSACAGIRNNRPVAMRMAINHYGGPNLPARPWLDAAHGDDHTGEHFMSQYDKALRKAISGMISSSTPMHVRRDVKFAGPRDEIKTERVESGRLFGKASYGSGGATVMRTLALQMAKNQTDFIANGLMEPNKESTVYKKGFNKPLVWTMEAFKSIEGWIE